MHDFAERLTQGRASWLAALHDGVRDADNPHAHIILRDRDAMPGPNQGKRVMMTTERGTIDHIRALWEARANHALERAGSAARIDRRTLKAQGIAREAQIHEGPKSQVLAEKGVPMESRPAELRRIDFTTGQRVTVTVTVDYPAIDQGRTRADYNAEIRARNAARARGVVRGDQGERSGFPTLRQGHTDYGALRAPDAHPDRAASPWQGNRPATGQPVADTVAAQARELELRQVGGASSPADWTQRGGMVAQQTAANVWLREAAKAKQSERIEGQRAVNPFTRELSDKERALAAATALDRGKGLER